MKLVLGIARLGEADLFAWWRSRGFTEAGQYVLGSALPTTWQWSALEGDVLSAAERHEEVFGRPTAIHLFSDRLPAKLWALGWLREQKVAGSADGFLARIRGWDPEAARREIAEWAAVQPPRGEVLAEGRKLGSLQQRDLEASERVEAVIRTLAAAYVDLPQEFRFPYFDLI